MYTFSDTRTDVLGAPVVFEEDKMLNLCARAGLSTDVEVVVESVDLDTEMVGSIEWLNDGAGPFRITVSVQDRLEFSESAVRRINRNLANAVAQCSFVWTIRKMSFETPQAYGLMLVGSTKGRYVAALSFERIVRDDPALWALSAESVVAHDS